jgi:hypothetical protein
MQTRGMRAAGAGSATGGRAARSGARRCIKAQAAAKDPLLLRVARGEGAWCLGPGPGAQWAPRGAARRLLSARIGPRARAGACISGVGAPRRPPLPRARARAHARRAAHR